MKVSFSLISASRFYLILLFEDISKEKAAVLEVAEKSKQVYRYFLTIK